MGTEPKKRKARPARLDKDGTAKPLTKIVTRVPREWCVGPATVGAEGYEIRDVSPHGGDDGEK